MNKVQRLYLLIAGLLGLGIPFLFIGLQVPSAMHASILADAAEYSILDEEDQNFWAEIPGRTGMQVLKNFYLFNCTNPEEVALDGAEPEFVEVGPFKYRYRHTLASRAYSDDSKGKDTRVSFIKDFRHEYMGIPDELQKEYRVINLSGLKRWRSIKKKERFQLAIEGFFETFQYSKINLLRDLAIRGIIKYFIDPRRIYALVEDIDKDKAEFLAYDEIYGLVTASNVYEWSFMCDTYNPYIEHEIITYFNFSMTNFQIVKKRFCTLYEKHTKEMKAKVCEHIPEQECTGYNISYYQWMYMNVTDSYKNTTFKKLNGIYEFHNFTEKFMQKLDEKYIRQFENVNWKDKSYHHILDTYFEYPDYTTDPASVLLFENMKKLYAAGIRTKNPFKPEDKQDTTKGNVKQEWLDLSRFEEIANILKMTKENAFMLYSYFEYYMNNTVLIIHSGGNLDRERIGNYGAAVLKDIAEYFRDFIDLLLYSHTLYEQNKGIPCEQLTKKFFGIKEVWPIMDKFTKAVCLNDAFNTNITTPVGWKYFIESAAYPHGHFYKTLNAYLIKEADFKEGMLDLLIFDKESPFFRTLSKIKADVKIHYSAATGGTACSNKFSSYCTKRQLFVIQFYHAVITRNPFPASGLPKADSIAGWWRLIEPFIENNYTTSTEGFIDQELPDLPIEVPVEVPYLKKHYGEVTFSEKDVYLCWNYIKLFDTDMIYDLFLKIGKERPPVCGAFANYFFYNATRYWIRNVHFGPMFKRLYPEQAYFGYFDNFLKIEHDRLDYLKGDDCTVNPSIGYNPKVMSIAGDETFSHFSYRHRMYTGSSENKQLRIYFNYHERTYLAYQKLVFDESGDNCTFAPADPFQRTIWLSETTDGYQFAQHKGKSPQGHKMKIIDPNIYRPTELLRKNDESYRYKDIEVNTYAMSFVNDIFTPNGITVSEGFDIDSFFQYFSVITMPRYKNISESGMIIPRKIEYKYPLEEDYVPTGYNMFETYFMVEPYTGITMSSKKKMMVSLILPFDDLYRSKLSTAKGEFLPLYSVYENSDVSESFISSITESILSSHKTRLGLSISFSIIGGFLIVGGIALIIRSCFLKPEEITGISGTLLQDEEVHTADDQLARATAEMAPIGGIQADEEDLQEEQRVTGLNILDEVPINPADEDEPLQDETQENLLP